MPIPYRLEWVIDRTTSARHEPDAGEMSALVPFGVQASEARAEWQAILEHKWYLGERLGRDVGLRVAMLDYFENIKPARESRTLAGRERSMARSAALASLRSPLVSVERIFQDFLDTLWGVRSAVL